MPDMAGPVVPEGDEHHHHHHHHHATGVSTEDDSNSSSYWARPEADRATPPMWNARQTFPGLKRRDQEWPTTSHSAPHNAPDVQCTPTISGLRVRQMVDKTTVTAGSASEQTSQVPSTAHPIGDLLPSLPADASVMDHHRHQQRQQQQQPRDDSQQRYGRSSGHPGVLVPPHRPHQLPMTNVSTTTATGEQRHGGQGEEDDADSNDSSSERRESRAATSSQWYDDDEKKTRGRVRIKMEFIQNKLKRYTTFSKRKAGLMKKAYELSTLTGTQVMLLVASETGHVYTFATTKLQPMITSEGGKSLIQACLNAPNEPSSPPFDYGIGSDRPTLADPRMAATPAGDSRVPVDPKVAASLRQSHTGYEETELMCGVKEEADIASLQGYPRVDEHLGMVIPPSSYPMSYHRPSEQQGTMAFGQDFGSNQPHASLERHDLLHRHQQQHHSQQQQQIQRQQHQQQQQLQHQMSQTRPGFSQDHHHGLQSSPLLPTSSSMPSISHQPSDTSSSSLFSTGCVSCVAKDPAPSAFQLPSTGLIQSQAMITNHPGQDFSPLSHPGHTPNRPTPSNVLGDLPHEGGDRSGGLFGQQMNKSMAPPNLTLPTQALGQQQPLPPGHIGSPPSHGHLMQLHDPPPGPTGIQSHQQQQQQHSHQQIFPGVPRTQSSPSAPKLTHPPPYGHYP
ncbi:uncharacterized protein LOC135826280 [Sycon ciliatum]|uniref:uncharacterized protein LOC135826280 n=1 Tax=Sycon ciliatum TaxID=27933 RepID=UPI0031F614A9|eukprot:scpid59521/ scgid26768/ Serum response factor